MGDLGSSDTGFGLCTIGDENAPYNISLRPAPQESWHFLTCPDCQCNGHSTCDDPLSPSTCTSCAAGFTGDLCQTCDTLSYGDARNGGNCTDCECNDHAEECNSDSGKCLCDTMGMDGDNCQVCDEKNGYHGNAINDTCFYTLSERTQYTFNQVGGKTGTYLNFDFCIIQNDDLYIRILSADQPINVDIFLNYTDMPNNMTLTSSFYNLTDITGIIDKSEIGPGTCLRIYISDITQPGSQLQVLIFHTLNLALLIGLFFLCFLCLVLLLGILWKVHQILRLWHVRQEREVDIKKMASRPFYVTHLETGVDESSHHKDEGLDDEEWQKKMSAATISEEVCSGEGMSVYTAILLQPQCLRQSCATGETSIILASTVGMASKRWSNISISNDDIGDSNSSISKKSDVMRRMNRFVSGINPRRNQTSPSPVPPQTHDNGNVNLTFEEEGTSDV